jgi:hypothetical protein
VHKGRSLGEIKNRNTPALASSPPPISGTRTRVEYI